MSWSINIPATSKAEFNAAVDAADLISNQRFDLVGVTEDVLTAKGLLKAIAMRVKREWVSGSAQRPQLTIHAGR